MTRNLCISLFCWVALGVMAGCSKSLDDKVQMCSGLAPSWYVTEKGDCKETGEMICDGGPSFGGAAVGYLFGGPLGAAAGYAIASEPIKCKKEVKCAERQVPNPYFRQWEERRSECIKKYSPSKQ